jgi:hypothetical protein
MDASLLIITIFWTAFNIAYFTVTAIVLYKRNLLPSHPFWITILGIIVSLFIYIAGVGYGNTKGYERGQKDALKGKTKYEMHVLYLEADTIPYDTVFVEIKK